MRHIDLLAGYLKNPGNFSILILGERGTGKTKYVKQLVGTDTKSQLIMANCASFGDDTMAESELFGHVKDAFTGATKEKDGLFKQADNGVLFLDEVHNLSPRVQEKIMTALQTEGTGKNKGKFCIRRLGDNHATYVTVRPVFASNLNLVDLRKKILPDLYDRISQLVIEIPSIHESKVDLIREFKNVWDEMRFEKYSKVPILSSFQNWLKRIALEGNYRTLQNIAINWHQARLIYGENKEEEIFDFVKGQFSKFYTSHSSIISKTGFNFRKGASKKYLEKEYQKALYDWAISEDGYGSPTEAQKGLSISRLANPHKKV